MGAQRSDGASRSGREQRNSGSPPNSGTPQKNATPRINDTRWSIGWKPLQVVAVPTIALTIVGVAVDQIAVFLVLGVLVGVAVWYWGVAEINQKYPPLIDDFRESTRNRTANETGGVNVHSLHTFISTQGSSPSLVEPAPSYSAAHIIFGDTSVIINEEFRYDMRDRSTYRGGQQAELFYDQISNVRSESYVNYAILEISLSSGQVKEIPSRDPNRVESVKGELQQNIRAVRR